MALGSPNGPQFDWTDLQNLSRPDLLTALDLRMQRVARFRRMAEHPGYSQLRDGMEACDEMYTAVMYALLRGISIADLDAVVRRAKDRARSAVD